MYKQAVQTYTCCGSLTEDAQADERLDEWVGESQTDTQTDGRLYLQNESAQMCASDMTSTTRRQLLYI